jgi:hypothetical protein
MPPGSRAKAAAAGARSRAAPPEQHTRVLVEAVGLSGYRVADNGSAADLALVDASGVEVVVTIPQEGVASLILTLPTILDQLLRRRDPDSQARFVFGTADWRIELGSDRQSLILTLETPDRFRVSFALSAELSRGIGRALVAGADRVTPPPQPDAPTVLQ